MDHVTTVARQRFDTTDPEVANHALGQMYGDVRSWVFGNPDGFTYRLRAGATGALATAHMRFTMGFGINADLAPTHHTLLVMLGGDHYHVKSQYGDVVLRSGDVAVVPAGAALDVSLEALDVITVSVPAEDLSRTAEELYGVPAPDVAISDMAPASVPGMRYVRRLAALASSELLAEDSAMTHPLILDSTINALCVGLLGAFPTTATSATPSDDAVGVLPRAYRRAVAFIDGNAERPITLSDIAAAAGTSARAVQQAFVRHLGTTPTAYLRAVRLEHARRELQAADPTTGATVAEIARRWGFAKPGRFAAAYRAKFGVNPHQTLRT